MNHRMIGGLVILALFIPLGASCSCIEQSPEQSLNRSSAVFSGTVMETQSRASGDEMVSIAVDTVWNGDVSKNMIVTTPESGASCGYNFVEGRSYLVYADGDPLSVSLCSRTKPIEDASEDLDVLGEGSGPDGFSNAPGQYVVVHYGGWLILGGLFLLSFVFLYRKQLLGVIGDTDDSDEDG